MYIIDDVSETSLSQVTLMLDAADIKQMIFDLEQLLENKDDPNYHCHISDASYQKEITVCLLDKNDTNYVPFIKAIIAAES